MIKTRNGKDAAYLGKFNKLPILAWLFATWIGGIPPAPAASPVVEITKEHTQSTSRARQIIQQYSQKIAALVAERPVINFSREIATPAEFELQLRLDAEIRSLRLNRRPVLIELVKSLYPAVDVLNHDQGLLTAPIVDDSGKVQKIFGSVLPMWHIQGIDQTVLTLAPAVSFQPDSAVLPASTKVKGRLLLGGTTSQNAVHPYPGDIDFAEELIIYAPSESAAEEAMAAAVVEFVARSLREPNVEFDTLIVFPAAESRNSNAEYKWSAERVLDPSQRRELVRQLASTKGLGRINSNWRALTVDGRYIVIGKIFRFVAKHGQTGKQIFSTYPMAVDFQEVYLGEKPVVYEDLSLGEYASLMRSLAKKEASLNNYLKAAKRTFNYSRAIGDLKLMEAVIPIFSTPEARINAAINTLEAVAMALDPATASSILTVKSAKAQLIKTATLIKDNLFVAPGTIPSRPTESAKVLQDIASELRSRTDQPGILKPNQDLAEQLENLIEVEIEPMIKLALKSRVSLIIDSL